MDTGFYEYKNRLHHQRLRVETKGIVQTAKGENGKLESLWLKLLPASHKDHYCLIEMRPEEAQAIVDQLQEALKAQPPESDVTKNQIPMTLQEAS